MEFSPGCFSKRRSLNHFTRAPTAAYSSFKYRREPHHNFAGFYRKRHLKIINNWRQTDEANLFDASSSACSHITGLFFGSVFSIQFGNNRAVKYFGWISPDSL
jgi:hypothetical protein